MARANISLIEELLEDDLDINVVVRMDYKMIYHFSIPFPIHSELYFLLLNYVFIYFQDFF